jgi:hypothetical protein
LVSGSSKSRGSSACGGLFLFEFVEGNTIIRIEYRRTLRQSRQALARTWLPMLQTRRKYPERRGQDSLSLLLSHGAAGRTGLHHLDE